MLWEWSSLYDHNCRSLDDLLIFIYKVIKRKEEEEEEEWLKKKKIKEEDRRSHNSYDEEGERKSLNQSHTRKRD